MSDTITDVDRWSGTVPVPYQSKNTSMDRVYINLIELFIEKYK